MGGGFKALLGGKGANQAVGCSMGSETHLVGGVGVHTYSATLTCSLAEEGAGKSRLIADPRHIAVAFILHNEHTGENVIVVSPDTNTRTLHFDPIAPHQ